MAEWSTAFINNLPDSSFAYIAPGGKKDSDGKTTPRDLRHLPYKDADGTVDHNHTANAIGRLPGTQIPNSVKAGIKAKLQRALGTTHSADLDGELKDALAAATAITPDSNGNLPTRFPLLSTFDLPKSNRGHFKVVPADLQEIKEKFDAGVYFPSDDPATGLKIDLDHSPQNNGSTEAAAWIHALDVVPDQNDPENKATLFADKVEWTDLGADKVRTGRYKMISPTGSFGTRNGRYGAIPHHTDSSIKLANVLIGAGLTNEPFQSMMSPIRLSAGGDNSQTANDNVIYVYDAQQQKELNKMNLNELRVKPRDQLTVVELDYLEENKADLSAAELERFKLSASTDDNQVSEEDTNLLAAIKDGKKKVVDASTQNEEQERLSKMESTVERYRKQEVEDLLDKHVKRGAIKHDQAKLDGFWGKQLLNASTDGELKNVKDALEALPANKELVEELGTGEDIQAGSTAREQLDKLAKERVEKAAKEGKTILYSDALKAVYHENKDLMSQDSQEQKSKASVLTAAGV